ncbi:YiiX/YebB-like N1pC/P60 family cysteine hydrolase [Vibrio parahaemolyticus]|nr:hypothetical protein [Vibrio parahaemolyticus]
MTFGALIDKVINIHRSIIHCLFFATVLLSLYIQGDVLRIIMIIFILFNILTVSVAYLFHRRLKARISNDLNDKIYVISKNNVTDFGYPAGMIMHPKFELPSDIAAEPNATTAYNQLKHIPYIHLLFDTIYNYSYYKFDWLQADKERLMSNLSLLKKGDLILYHRKSSVVGKLIRFFCKCYWEHCAVYIGGGELIESVPPKVKKTNISEWLVCSDVEIAVVRPKATGESITVRLESEDFEKRTLGKPYDYHSVLLKLWGILTHKQGDGIIKFYTLVFVLVSYLVPLCLVVFYPNTINAAILMNYLISIYALDSLSHWMAFNPSIEQILNNNPVRIFGN